MAQIDPRRDDARPAKPIHELLALAQLPGEIGAGDAELPPFLFQPGDVLCAQCDTADPHATGSTSRPSPCPAPSLVEHDQLPLHRRLMGGDRTLRFS
jgi:hypothetical protein